jgi:NAD(P)-dependent dehydrogenase (short-subunit alcohol dehydrogenase family)
MATVLITGCSQGIGFETALELGRAGHRVIATMRNPAGAPQLGQIAAAERLPVDVRDLDVNSDASVKACFGGISEPIDVLVNNAGIEVHGTVEETPMDSVIAVMDTNYFGTVRCIQAVLPQMRERRSGCIINVSSVAGKISNSPLGAYSATKHAVEAISEALAGEVKAFGIRVAIVQPGIQDTRMARQIAMAQSAIYVQPGRLATRFRESLSNPVPPSVTARIVREIVESGTWKLRYPSGSNAAPLLAWRASKSDEEFVEWTAQDDESMERDFGIKARAPERE